VITATFYSLNEQTNEELRCTEVEHSRAYNTSDQQTLETQY
jgi:hypothetical protein